MFGRILQHEWRSLRADATIWVVGGLFAAAIGYGVWNGARWVAFQRTALAEASQEEAGRIDRLKAQVADIEQSGKPVSPFADPRSPANVGGRFGLRYAMLPPGPLAPLAQGSRWRGRSPLAAIAATLCLCTRWIYCPLRR